MDDGNWHLELGAVPDDVDVERCFEEILPEETARLIERTLAKGGLPDGFRRFLEAFRDGDFDDHEGSESFSLLLLAVALSPRKGAVPAAGPDPEVALLVVGGVAGVNALWREFLADPKNARFGGEPLAGEWMAHMLRLRGLLEAGIVVMAVGIHTGSLTREALGSLLESAVRRLCAKTAAN